MSSEFHGVVVRGNRVTYVCADCGRFIKNDQVGNRYIPQFGEPGDPETEFYHANGCPPKKGRAI
jgi:hypothetical protein